MLKSRFVVAAVLTLLAIPSLAQVVTPAEIKDPELRALQQQYMDDLKAIGQEIVGDSFEYPFYLSRKLDLDEIQQQRADQRSIRFDHYGTQVVLAIQGNYYAAYSADQVNKDQRARETLLHVVAPILKAAVPRFQNNKQVKGYAVEVSHHIRGKVMGVSMERPENLMVYLPQSAAIRLVGAKDDTAKQAALLAGQIFLNAEPITVFLTDAPLPSGQTGPPVDTGGASDSSSQAAAEIVPDAPNPPSTPAPSFPGAVPKPQVTPPRDTSREAIATLQTANADLLTKMVKELDPQAHFVNYAPPSFIAFRQSIYLQLPLNTSLPESAGGSRYRVAAMAFDDHVAHLIRPVAAYFKEDQNFDGISFSATVHLPGKSPAAATSQAVEFFFPLSAMRCYEKYDCTGQQLIDAGTVLINGERVSLDLQTAESR